MHQLDGARKKLERADENILNLHREICFFLNDGANPVVPHRDVKVVEQAVKAHIQRPIPARFSVLAGEIIHHLRSCLDHIAWELSSDEKKAGDPRSVEFPIYKRKPIDKSQIASYKRKVDGISDTGKRIIEQIQPYQRDPNFMLTAPDCDSLWIIHQMDATDKHREPVLTAATFDISAGGMESLWLMLYREANFPQDFIVSLRRAFNPDSKITTQISFQDFGGRKLQPVVPSLLKLTRQVRRVLTLFNDQCF